MRYFTKNGAKAKTEFPDKAEWLIRTHWSEVTKEEWDDIHLPSPPEEPGAEEILDIILGEEVGE